MDVTPIIETTGLAIGMRTSEARTLQADLTDMLRKRGMLNSTGSLAELNRKIESVLGPIEEPPF